MLSNRFTAAAIVVVSSLLLIPSALAAGDIRHEVEDVNIPAENGADVLTTWWEVRAQTTESQSNLYQLWSVGNPVSWTTCTVFAFLLISGKISSSSGIGIIAAISTRNIS